MQTIKKTTNRRHVIYLQAEHDDAGPYYLVDRAGYGVVWRKPARYAGQIGGTATWIPVFRRALVAFEMLEFNSDITPAEAKYASDKVAPMMEEMVGDTAMHHALRMVEHARAKKAKR